MAVVSVATVCNAAGCPHAPPNVIDDILCPERLLPNTEYRPIDGALQNTCNPTGKSFEPYGRAEKAHYSDCQAALRKAKSLNPLPPVRDVVNGVFRAFERNLTANYRAPNFLIAMMGQYIGHDIGASRELVDFNVIAQCCNNGALTPIESRHPACITIELPENDPDYYRWPNMQCLMVLRSENKDPTNRICTEMWTVSVSL